MVGHDEIGSCALKSWEKSLEGYEEDEDRGVLCLLHEGKIECAALLGVLLVGQEEWDGG